VRRTTTPSLLPRLLLFSVPVAAFVTVLALAGFGRLRAADPLEVVGGAPSFSGLIDQDERLIGADELRGRVVVANFIYTSCTDICPLLSARMRELQERLRRENLLGSEVQLLSFSVDPSRDTPEVLRAYAARNGADPTAWRFVTGSEEQLIPLIVEGFHLGVSVPPPQAAAPDGEADHGAYEVMHSGRFVLIDRDWRIRAYYDGREIEPERVLRDIRQVLG
jgi:protein SCO1/2